MNVIFNLQQIPGKDERIENLTATPTISNYF